MIYNGAENTLDDLEETVSQAVSTLALDAGKFDCIVVQGMSGVIVGVPVSMRLGKPLVIVRKESETSHGWAIINKMHLQGRWLFLDDFISTGTTRRRVEGALAGIESLHHAGTYTYRNDNLDLVT